MSGPGNIGPAEQLASSLCDGLIDLGYLSLVVLVQVAPDGRVIRTRLGGTVPRKVDALRVLVEAVAQLHAEIAAGGDGTFEGLEVEKPS